MALGHSCGMNLQATLEQWHLYYNPELSRENERGILLGVASDLREALIDVSSVRLSFSLPIFGECRSD